MIGESYPSDRRSAAQWHTSKRIPLDPAGDRAHQREADTFVVASRREDQRGPPSGLIAPELRRE
jgi:hypothetical protein